MNIGYALTGSFCTHKQSLEVLKKLAQNKNNNYIPILTDSVYNTNTRFGKAEDLINELKSITGNDPIHTFVDAEPLGPKNLIDILIVAPCTANTLSKLANAITDNAVTMAAKAIMRNFRPVIIAVSTNDGLGFSLQNIAKLLNVNGIYFVPFSQDNPEVKPKSLVSNWEKIEDTINLALEGKQIQPIITGIASK